jgi:hypothetical protein
MGLSIVISSAADPTAFVETRIREAEQAKREGKDYAYIANVVSYEVKRKQYSDDEFCVFLGTDTVDPGIIDTDDDLLKVLQATNFDISDIDERLSFIPIIKRHLPKELEMKFKFVPTTFRRLAEQNITKFIQDVIGHSGSDDNKLFKNRELFRVACEGKSNLFHKDTLILSMNDKIPLSEYFGFQFINPSLPRFIHVDQAVTRMANGRIENRLGMACTYVSKFDKEGPMTKHYIEVDFILAVNPPEKPDRIPLYKIKEFIIWLRDMGLNIGCVTFDQFQSEATIQELNVNGIKAERYSVDKDDKDWLNLVNLFYERRIKIPFHKVFMDEFFKLEHDTQKRKVDHVAGCFTGDTKVSLVDGRELTFIELEKEHKEGKENWVYSIDGKIKPKKIKDVWETKKVTQLIKVTLDNNEEIYCTPDHRFMKRDGVYCEAKDLLENDSLMPLYRKFPSKGMLMEYRLFYDPHDDLWHFEHRQFVAKNNDKSKTIVHHLNWTKEDNCPTNLLWVSKQEHIEIYHSPQPGWVVEKKKKALTGFWATVDKDSDWYKNRLQKMRDSQIKNRDPKLIEKIKKEEERVTAIEDYFGIVYKNLSRGEKQSYSYKWKNLTDSTIQERRKLKLKENHKQGKYQKAYTSMQISNEERHLNGRTEEEKDNMSKGVKSFLKTEEGKLYLKTKSENMKGRFTGEDNPNSHHRWSEEKKSNFAPWNKGLNKEMMEEKRNHKVLSIEMMEVDDIPVYDLQVDEGDNFALTAGVFVHNSFKDVSDAICGSVANAILKTGVGGHNLAQFANETDERVKNESLYEMIKNNRIPGMTGSQE